MAHVQTLILRLQSLYEFLHCARIWLGIGDHTPRNTSFESGPFLHLFLLNFISASPHQLASAMSGIELLDLHNNATELGRDIEIGSAPVNTKLSDYTMRT